jgi:starch synthase
MCLFMSIQRASHSIYTKLFSSSNLVDYTKSHYIYSSLPSDVRSAIEEVSSSKLINHPLKKALIVSDSYKITHLSNHSIAQLHEVISSYLDRQSKNSPFFIHLFNIEDHIFRQVITDPQSATKEYKSFFPNDYPLLKKIEKLTRDGSRFYKIESKTLNVSSPRDLQISPKEYKTVVNQNKPLKILRITAENSRNFNGGIAGVIVESTAAHKKLRSLNSSCSKPYSISPLYEKEKQIARDFNFQGILTHFYGGKVVHSTIYKNKETLEYLVQPDPSFARLFNTPLTKAPYSEGAIDRLLYLGSASAAFSAFYKGKTGDRQIHVLQCETMKYVLGSALPLLEFVYAPIRRAFGLREETRRVTVWHHGSVSYRSKCNPEQLELLGLNLHEKKGDKINLENLGLKSTEKVIYVSKELASRAIHPDPLINKGRRSLLLKPDMLVTIPNGVEIDKYDPTSRKSFKDLSLNRTFDANGVEVTDFIQYRKRLKKLLFEAGILKSPDLPLSVFVGRYAKEKGVDILVEMIKDSPSNVQFVCMGTGVMDSLQDLKELEKRSLKNRLKVLFNLDEQNLHFSHHGVDYKVPIGGVIRAAADFFIIPSHIEACSLVAMEALCSGAILIAPFHQGFKSICKPDGYPSSEGRAYSISKDANAFCYRNSSNIDQAKNALRQALQAFFSRTEKEQNELAARLRNNAVSLYSWCSIDLFTRTLSGGAVSYDCFYHDITGRPRLNTALVSVDDKESVLVSMKTTDLKVKPFGADFLMIETIKKIVKNVFCKISKGDLLSFLDSVPGRTGEICSP